MAGGIARLEGLRPVVARRAALAVAGTRADVARGRAHAPAVVAVGDVRAVGGVGGLAEQQLLHLVVRQAEGVARLRLPREEGASSNAT